MTQTDTTSAGLADGYTRNIGKIDGESYQASITTGASYADALLVDNRANVRGLVITFTETGAAQSFKYQILASIKDGTSVPTAGASPDASYRTLVADVTVAASAGDYQILVAPWKWVAIQVKNGSGAATVTVRARGL